MSGSAALDLDWRGILADLRAHLPPVHGTAGAVRGSLRWLESEMRAQGANPASVRNIVYRDIGTPADKAALAAILTALAHEAGRPLLSASLVGASLPGAPAPLPDELELLGRSKKRAYKQFLAGVRAGRTPRMIVTGRRGAGKTVLIDHLALALAAEHVPVLRLSLAGDASGQLPAFPAAGRSFAALAAAQAEAVRAAFPVGAGVLLARVTADLNFAGEPPRLPDGTPVSAAVWATEHLLRRAPSGLAVLLALEDTAELTAHWGAHLPAGVAELIELRPPTPAEARAYLMARLGIGRAAADALVRETGRNLDRLTLLASVGRGEAGQGESGAARLLADPDIRALAAALASLSVVALPAALPDIALGAALGFSPAALPTHARALLSGSSDAGWTAADVLQAALPLVPAAEAQAAALRLVAAFQDVGGVSEQEGRPESESAAQLAGFTLIALTLLQDWPALAAQVSRRPDDARYLPPLWPHIRGNSLRGSVIRKSKERAGASGEALEILARALATHHAGRGEYGDPRARDALFTLLESPRDPVRAWARVKLAESSVDAGNFEAARGQLAHPDLSGLLSEVSDPSTWPPSSWPPSSWTVAAQADALLVQAALARWSGDLEAATRAATDPRTAQGGPRAALWRGLIAKDAGRWPEALSALQSVPASSPLLSARARYQEGDLRLRLGQPAAALHALQDAAERLPRAGGSTEETARVLARAATAQRRLGHPAEGLTLLQRALGLLAATDAAPRGREDALPRARLLSEGLPILLALGRPDEALAQACAALSLLSGLLTVPGSRQAEAEYRLRRTQYRLALAYLTRGIGLPYLYPFCGPRRDHPDLQQARALLDQLLRPATGLSGTPEPDREQVLTFDMLLTRALADPLPASALSFAERALSMTDHPYAAAQAHAIRAEAYLRAGQFQTPSAPPAQAQTSQLQAALADINRAHALLRRVSLGSGSGQVSGLYAPDPGLAAQLLALEVRATITEGADTLLWLRNALQDPALHPFRAGVWREAGRALEAHHPGAEDVLRRVYPASSLARAEVLRVRDRLWVLEAELQAQD
ncbi:hypothetical protein [Deinococcus aquatilis]|uniref:hypothetical protein n=1 Tax=Deinococcus aquatilis TaxID=519440 RepID=UPI00037BE705|nr:hypothetical protein [Deinococcus aquatilis]